jgi:hypothetical protein
MLGVLDLQPLGQNPLMISTDFPYSTVGTAISILPADQRYHLTFQHDD